jgi:hypothetical protein
MCKFDLRILYENIKFDLRMKSTLQFRKEDKTVCIGVLLCHRFERACSFSWLLMLICFERKILLADSWSLVCSERKVPLAGG